MKTKLIITMLWFLVAGINNISAQDAPWSFVSTGVSHTIFLADVNVPQVDGSPIVPGDYIGVFYRDVNGQLQNAGYTQWTGSSTYITAYGDDGMNTGFKTGELLQYKIRRSGTGCDVIDIQAGYLSGSIYISGNQFQPDGISGLASLTGEVPEIDYPEICLHEQFAYPITEVFLEGKVKYRSNAPGLALDSLTGIIDIAESLPGTYTIEFVTDLCLRSYSTEFLVLPALSVINIPNTIISCEPYPIDLEGEENIFLWSTGETSSTIIIDSSGEYWVEITDKRGCKATKIFSARISNIVSSGQLVSDIVYTPCSNEAKVILDKQEISGGIFPYDVIVSNMHGQTLEETSDGGYLLPDKDSYNLRITDSLGCELILENAFTVNNPERCPYNVISPNRDGLAEGYYLEDYGIAKIYDRSGNLKNELTIPAEWDGTDRSGQVLPKGVYCIIVNGNKKKFVTIVW